MRQVLKDYFIPHEGNEHKPHLLRRGAVGVILVLVLFAQSLLLLQQYIVAPRSGLFATILPVVLVEQTNTARQENIIGNLKVSPVLEVAAKMKAEDMAAKSYFAHTSPEGKTPWYWFEQAGYAFTSAGENLAVRFTDSSEVTKAWLNSPGHRANIMNGDFTQIGIATAQGMYKGQETIFVVQLFGTPAPATIQNVPLAQATATPTSTVAAVVVEQEASKPRLNPAVVLETNTTTQEMSVSISGAAVPLTSLSDLGTTGSSQTITPSPTSLLERLFTTPKPFVGGFYVLMAALVLIALVLKLSVNSHIRHPHLILNGILILVIIAGAVFMNQYVFNAGARIF